MHAMQPVSKAFCLVDRLEVASPYVNVADFEKASDRVERNFLYGKFRGFLVCTREKNGSRHCVDQKF